MVVNDGFFVLTETQDERAVGVASFAHGGRGGTKSPRKRPRVSGARKRLLRIARVARDA